MEEKVQDGMFATEMTIDWYFDAETMTSTEAYVANSEANTKAIYFEVAMEDGKTIYTSTVIPVGYSINSIKLEDKLDAGDYTADCIYYLLNDNGEVNSSVAVTVYLHIA